jgi:hypothetical protein
VSASTLPRDKSRRRRLPGSRCLGPGMWSGGRASCPREKVTFINGPDATIGELSKEERGNEPLKELMRKASLVRPS